MEQSKCNALPPHSASPAHWSWISCFGDQIQDQIVTVLLLLQPWSADTPTEGASVNRVWQSEAQLQHLWEMHWRLSKIFESENVFQFESLPITAKQFHIKHRSGVMGSENQNWLRRRRFKLMTSLQSLVRWVHMLGTWAFIVNLQEGFSVYWLSAGQWISEGL